MLAIRLGVIRMVCLLVSLVLPSAAAAQGYFVETSGDYFPVQIGATSQTWQAARLSGGWLTEGQSGWTMALERQQRERLTDWGLAAQGFQRKGDWTFSGGLGVGADPTFSYRRSLQGELAKRVVGTLVVHGGYRHLAFQSATVQLIQPAATLYLPHGDIGARYFIVRNSTRESTAGTFQIQANVIVNPRLRVGGGGAFGERIFDVASLQTPRAQSWVGFGYAHITANRAWSFDVALGRAHEDPGFSQGMLTFGVRRTFGPRP